MIKKKDIAKRYDSSAEVYDNRYSEIQWSKYQEILAKVSLNSSEIILDAGCGTGSLLKIISEMENEETKLIGIDISFEMIKIAHQKLSDIDFIVADLDSIPLKENVVSKIFSTTVLQNLPNPLSTLKEMKRILTLNGKAAITILSKSWTIERLVEIIEESNLTMVENWKANIEDICAICVKEYQ